jgi:predicted O-methyltransferase YrrM
MRQIESLLQKANEAVRLAPKAAYALYFDVLRKDPDHLACAARAGIRDACFITGRDHQLRSVTLLDWLSQFAPLPDLVTVPFEICNEGVGGPAYFHTLAAICAALRPSQIVEFGTFLGIGTSVMALNCEAQILTIDLPDAAHGEEIETLNQADSTLVDQSRNRVGRHHRGKSFSRRITELRCDSRYLDLARHIDRADLCLIDGGHSYECVARDTENAFRVLAPGGVMIWDDYFWLYPDVVRYLNELSRTGRSMVRIKGTNLILFRNQPADRGERNN